MADRDVRLPVSECPAPVFPANQTLASRPVFLSSETKKGVEMVSTYHERHVFPCVLGLGEIPAPIRREAVLREGLLGRGLLGPPGLRVHLVERHIVEPLLVQEQCRVDLIQLEEPRCKVCRCKSEDIVPK